MAIALLPVTAAWALPDCDSLKRGRMEDVQACSVWGFVDQPCRLGEMVVDEAVRAALLGVSTFSLTPVSTEVTMTWHRDSGAPAYPRMPPAVDTMFQPAVGLDMVRRSVFASRDGSSVYIVDNSGPLQEIRWFGPLSWREVRQLCREAVSK